MNWFRNPNEVQALNAEQVAYLTQKRYDKSSKQTPSTGQTSLFDEPEEQADDGECPDAAV